MQQIVIVDDSPVTLQVCKRALQKLPDVDVHEFASSTLAFSYACEHQPDLIVLDYRMPEMDGLEFIERFRKSSKDPTIPIIVLTSSNDAEVRHRALQLGASDFLQKPSDPIEFLARTRNLLRLHKTERELDRHSTLLREQMRASTTLISTQEREMLQSLTRIAGYLERDGNYGRQHGSRVGDYAELMARKLGFDRNFRHIISVAAPLHDIGKIGIPDKILFKPGKLTPEQFEQVKAHAKIGYEILAGGSSLIMKTAADVAGFHHERWDGKGYPHGLKGTEIPVAARIVAIADVFDALMSVRPQRSSWSLPDALEAIRRGAGESFDPEAAKVFVESQIEIGEIRRQHDGARAA